MPGRRVGKPAGAAELRLRLDPLSHDFAADAVDQPDHCLRDRARLGIGRDMLDKAAVELHPVERQIAQPGEVGITGPEIVDRDAGAVGAERRDGVDHLTRAMHRQRLGDLELKQPRRRARRLHRIAQPAEEGGMVQLARADIDRHALFDAHFAPAGDRIGDILDHPFADLDDQAGLLGAGDEGARQAQTTLGMLPAQQRFRCDDPAIRGADLRLIDQRKLIALDRAAQVAFKLCPLGDLGGKPIAEMLCTPAAIALGMIHGRVRRAHQIGQRRTVLGPHRDAHRRTDAHFLIRQVERLGQREQDAATHAVGVAYMRQHGEEDGELVARKPADERLAEVALRGKAIGHRAQPVGDHAQQLIAHRVTERVVHRLEPVEIDEEQRRHRVVGKLGQRPLAAAAEMDPVGQRGDRIEQREPLHALQV